MLIGIHRRLTIRSSRPHVVASATCFCATLARVRRPATGRLNSGVRPIMKLVWICPACDYELPDGHERCVRCACPRDADQQVIDSCRARYNSTRPMHEKAGFVCMKCGGQSKESGELRASGGALSSIFDISTNRFRYVTCSACGYTEFYRADMGALGVAAEFLGS